jgi:type IV pilus assembly protein PilY1
VTKLFDQTTLFNLNANEDNGRYSYFSMDAGLGLSDGGFWLFDQKVLSPLISNNFI